MEKGLVYSYINDIARRLKDKRKYGSASVMIGAGFSKNAEYCGEGKIVPPNWNELADKMFLELYPKVEGTDKEQEDWNKQRIIKTSGKNVTKLAEEYIVCFGRNQIEQMIEEEIADDLFVPSELHKRLLELKWDDIFTTNYDSLLERANDGFRGTEKYHVVYSQNDLHGSNRPRIIKLHGSIPQVKPYIICDEDYRTYPVKYSALVNTVQQSMLETRLCLIGFSGDDPDFQSWLGWLRDNMGESCPKIYLIGLYDSISFSERKLLEDKQITIIDISVLAEKEENRYYEALSKFITLLKDYQEDEEIEIPFKKADIFWNPKDKQGYLDVIEKYASKVWGKIKGYVLLPENERREYEQYFHIHFSIIMYKCFEYQNLNALSYIVNILRKCLVVLDDDIMKRIAMICDKFQELSFADIQQLQPLILYLLEMERIDGKEEQYKEHMQFAEKLLYGDKQFANDLIIEKIKKDISDFSYSNARELINQIEEINWLYKVKKAGLYKQLDEGRSADIILKQCAAELAQMKIGDKVYASYLGYLNLCYRIDKWEIDDIFSDKEWYKEEYNTRHIIVKQREELGQMFFDDDCKNDEVISFNLNSSRGITYHIGMDVLYLKSFNFLLSIDTLCLPAFGDQAKLFPRVIHKVIGSSLNTSWKLSLAARTNEEKIIDRIFNREMLAQLDVDGVKKTFDDLMELERTFADTDSYIYKKHILTIKNVYDIMSRLVVFLDDDDIIHFIKRLCRFGKHDYEIVCSEIGKVLDRIKKRFNKKIGTELQEYIFVLFNVKCGLVSFFEDIDININDESKDKYYKNALMMLNNEDSEIRDYGVKHLLLLWRSLPLETYEKEISKRLWNNVIKELPKSECFYPDVWERLPHPSEVEFSELYYTLLCNSSVKEDNLVGSNNVNIYCNVFYRFSSFSFKECKKPILDKDILINFLTKIEVYVEKHKSTLEDRRDFLGERAIEEQKFLNLSQLLAMIYMEAFLASMVESVIMYIDALDKKLEILGINRSALYMAKSIEQRKYDLCINIFESIIMSREHKLYPSAFLGLEFLLSYIDKVYEKKEVVMSHINNFIYSIKYVDVECAKKLWRELSLLIKHPFFYTKEEQAIIAVTAEKCVDIYLPRAQQGERFYLDCIYNCVETMKKYVDILKDSGIQIFKELNECIETIKQIKNLEYVIFGHVMKSHQSKFATYVW